MESITSPATLFKNRKLQSIQPIDLLRYTNVKEANSLNADWLKIGGDLKQVIENYESAISKK
jgi:hypothetical protein